MSTVRVPGSGTPLSKVAFVGLLCLIHAPMWAQSCVKPASGLVSWWRGEQSAKDTANNNPGLASAGTKYVAGKVGRAFAFDGINDVVLVPDAPSLGFTSTASFTIELWAYRTSSASTQHLVGKRIGCTNPPFYGVAIGAGAFSTSSFPLNTWTHAAVTYNGGTGSQELYVNGNLVSAANAASFFGINNAALTIGTMGSCAGFGGYLDEVSLYNRTLSVDEIRAVVNAGSAGKCDPTPSCSIRLDRSAYLSGDPIVARTAVLANPGTSPRPVEVKLWFEQPDGVTTIPYLTAGADGSFVLPPGFSGDYAPLVLSTVQPTTPRGTHKLYCRVFNAVTGEILFEESNAYQVQ